jgi:hypothetical protein
MGGDRGTAVCGKSRRPALGGVLYSLGRAVPFLGDSVSYGVSVLTSSRLRGQFSPAKGSPAATGCGAKPSKASESSGTTLGQQHVAVAVLRGGDGGERVGSVVSKRLQANRRHRRALERRVEREDPAVGRHEPVAPGGRVGGHPRHRGAQRLAPHRAVEGGVTKAEDPPVSRHQPVAPPLEVGTLGEHRSITADQPVTRRAARGRRRRRLGRPCDSESRVVAQ